MVVSPRRMRHVVYLANLLFSFAGAITIYTNSSFIENTVGIELVGVLYAVSSILSILILSRGVKKLAKLGNRTFFLFYGALYALSLLLLVLPTHAYLQIIAFVIYLFSTNILIFSLNVFFERLAKIVGRGNMRGSFLLLGNIGIMLGPIIAARAIDMGGFSGMYTIGLVVFCILAVILHFGLKNYIDAPYTPNHWYSALRHTLKEKTLRSVIGANFILQFFYAWMVVYTPIYLSKYLGFSWDTIGIIFALMLTTFVILDYPLGRLADWLGSEKELAAFGFLIMAGSVFGLALLPIPNVIFIGALLFFSRVGAATVEAMTEIHFYKIAKASDPGLLSLFCDLRPLSYIVAPLLGALALAFLPFQSIFIILGIVLLFGFFISLYMEKKQEWWVREHRV